MTAGRLPDRTDGELRPASPYTPKLASRVGQGGAPRRVAVVDGDPTVPGHPARIGPLLCEPAVAVARLPCALVEEQRHASRLVPWVGDLCPRAEGLTAMAEEDGDHDERGRSPRVMVSRGGGIRTRDLRRERPASWT